MTARQDYVARTWPAWLSAREAHAVETWASEAAAVLVIEIERYLAFVAEARRPVSYLPRINAAERRRCH